MGSRLSARVVGALMALWMCAATARASVNPYEARRAEAVEGCEAIPRREYQTGLLLNPDGYRSYYVRSMCFQQTAVLFRDANLCREVRRRWSLFSSSWGYSAGNCRKLVAEGLVSDSTALQSLKVAYGGGPVRLTRLRIERNGNGRDLDVVPAFAPGHEGSYELRIEVEVGGVFIAIDSTGYHLDGNDSIRGFVQQSDVQSRVTGYAPGRTYHCRATLTFDVGWGGQAGVWSDAFIDRIFPASQRAQMLVFDAVL